MAERLYRDAVQRGRIPEDTRIPLAALSQETGEICARLKVHGIFSNLQDILTKNNVTRLPALLSMSFSND